MLVSNTSTLVLLAKISCLELFLQSTPAVMIPEEVRKEATLEEDAYYARLIKKLIAERKLTVKNADNHKMSKAIAAFRLDIGEAAAYALFDSGRHDALLTDDGELIKLCRLEKITFICAMAVVVSLFGIKKLSKQEALEKLSALREVGRYSQAIYEHFRMEVE